MTQHRLGHLIGKLRHAETLKLIASVDVAVPDSGVHNPYDSLEIKIVFNPDASELKIKRIESFLLQNYRVICIERTAAAVQEVHYGSPIYDGELVQQQLTAIFQIGSTVTPPTLTTSA